MLRTLLSQFKEVLSRCSLKALNLDPKMFLYGNIQTCLGLKESSHKNINFILGSNYRYAANLFLFF